MPTSGSSIGPLAGFASVAGVGNGADLTNDALWALPGFPAGAGLVQTGDSLLIDLVFRTAINGNDKNAGITIAGSQVNFASVFTFNNLIIMARVIITRASATAVNVGLFGVSNSGVIAGGSINLAVPSMDSNATALVITGQSPTSGAANDIKLFSGVATYIK